MRRSSRAAAVLTALLAVLVAVEALFVPYEKPRFPWHGLPGYSALIGFGACLVVVVASKALGRVMLQRPEPSDD
jgi:hypothetical protein